MLFFNHLCGILVNQKLSQLRICEEFDHLPFWIMCAFHVFCWECHYCLWHGANPVIALIGISALACHEFSRELAENAACWQACPFTECPASLPVLFVSVSPFPFLLRGLSLAKHARVPLLHMPQCCPGPATYHLAPRPCASLAASPASHSCCSCPPVCQPHTVPSWHPHLSSVLFNVLFAFRAHQFWVWWLFPFSRCRNLLHISGTLASFMVPEVTRL